MAAVDEHDNMGDFNDEIALARDADVTQKSTPDTTRRDALERSVAARLPMLGEDELSVIDTIVTRISSGGRDQYGELHIATDRRDYYAEAGDEFADALWYMAAQVVRRSNERRERLRCEAADELARTTPVEKVIGELSDTPALDLRLRGELTGGSR